MDHGMLNVPLHKRGNIDREIDALKASQRAAAKAEARERTALRAECVELVAALPAETVARMAKRTGLTEPAWVKRLSSQAHYDPATFAPLLRKMVTV